MRGGLLDTLVVLRFLLAPQKLSGPTTRILEDPSIRLYYSSVNLWEIAIKLSVGGFRDLRLQDDWEILFPQALSESSIERLDIEANDCKRVENLPFHHRDPFDRMLVAQSIGRGLDILSSDAAFDAYEVRRIW